MTVVGTEKSRSWTVFSTAVQNVGVGEDLFIEAQAHELLRSARGDLVERVHDGLRERQEEDGAEEQQRGEDEQESRTVPAIQVVPGERDAKPLAHGSRTAATHRWSPVRRATSGAFSDGTGTASP